MEALLQKEAAMPEDEHRFQLRLPRDLYERLSELADREKRTVNAQLLVVIEKALGPVRGKGTRATVIAALAAEDAAVRRELVRNASVEAREALALVVADLGGIESRRQLTENEWFLEAVTYAQTASPTVAVIEEIGLAAVDHGRVDVVRTIMKFAGDLIGWTDSMNGGIRFAQGMPAFLALRLLLLVGAKAVEERDAAALRLLIHEPLEARSGSDVSIEPLWKRRRLFFPEAFLGHADLPMRYLNNLWAESPHIRPYFASEASFRESFVIFSLLLSFRRASVRDEVLYPGYRLIDGAQPSVQVFATRVANDSGFRKVMAEGLGESESDFVDRWPARIEAANAARLGGDYFDWHRGIPSVEFS